MALIAPGPSVQVYAPAPGQIVQEQPLPTDRVRHLGHDNRTSAELEDKDVEIINADALAPAGD